MTRAPGYLLRLGEGDSDPQVFDEMVHEGGRVCAPGTRRERLACSPRALALWRAARWLMSRRDAGRTEAGRLAELRLDAAELRITAELACGGAAQVIPELRRLLADHPLREGLWVLLMRALDGAGRHAEALDAYGQARSALADELGIDPGAELRQPTPTCSPRMTLLTKDAGDAPGSISAGTVTAGARPPAPAVGRAPGSAIHPRPRPAAPDVADFTGREDQIKHRVTCWPAAVRKPTPARSASPRGRLRRPGQDVPGRTRGPPGPRRFPRRPALRRPAGGGPPAAPARGRAGPVPARPRRDGRDVPADDDERAARYRTVLAGRRCSSCSTTRVMPPRSGRCCRRGVLRGADHDPQPDARPGQHQAGRPQRARRRRGADLFTKVVGDERAAAEPEATAELLLACAGLPLAIRICAARLATRSGWTIGAMASRLRDEHRRLDELRAGDLAVRASFQVSFASLPAEAQPDGVAPADAFRLLGLWQGPSISAAAAAALFGMPEHLAEDALETLVDAHLLESTSPDRYKFHDLLRVYSSERAVADLPEPDRDAAIGRLLRWYMQTSDAAPSEPVFAAPLQHSAGRR